MTRAVFTSRIDSGYDDAIEQHYHFPGTYLRAVEATVGDLIVYYEPRRGAGTMSYFGTAEVVGVRSDPRHPGHYYADLANYLDFQRKVPFQNGDHYYESLLRKSDGSPNRGAFGRSVRLIPEHEFDAIAAAGHTATPEWPDTISEPAGLADVTGFAEETQLPFGIDRSMVVFSRPFRDRAFARIVQSAYDRRCAVTGLRLLNGGGRPEVQAAHIQPVGAEGPDSIRNGVALSGTMHWLFDRGLMTFGDDYSIRLVANDIPEEVRRLVNPTGRLILPARADQRPAAPSCVFTGRLCLKADHSAPHSTSFASLTVSPGCGPPDTT